MVHADKLLAGHPRDRLRGLQPDEQRADQAGRVRHRDPVDVGERRAGVVERRADHRDDVLDVRARRELGHDPAVTRMDLVLRRDDLAPHRLAIDHDRRGRLVARALDPEDVHGCCSSCLRIRSARAPVGSSSR
jgi:hypothetical protein